MKNSKHVILAFIGILLVCSVSYAKAELSFKVIVNASNSKNVLTTQEISKLFLKKVTHWKGSNASVLPIDLVEDSPVRKRFSEEIHGRKVSLIKAYWQNKIFSGRGVPPPEKASDKDVLKYVEENTNAIGYVSESAQFDSDSVKIVEIAD